jgi:hypothetical protein
MARNLTVTCDLNNFSFSQYLDSGFSSIVEYNKKLYGVKNNTLYYEDLSGNVDSRIKLKKIFSEDFHIKRFRYIVLQTKGTGTIDFKIINNEQNEYNETLTIANNEQLQNYRIYIPYDMIGEYFDIEINISGNVLINSIYGLVILLETLTRGA